MSRPAFTVLKMFERARGIVLSDQHLLVGCDGSGRDLEALAQAAQAARRSRARLTVTLVLETSWLAGFAALMPGGVELLMLAEKAAIDGFRLAVEQLPDDISVTTLVRRGPRTQTLAATAAQQRCGTVMIAPGSSQRSIRRLTRAVRNRCGASVLVACEPLSA